MQRLVAIAVNPRSQLPDIDLDRFGFTPSAIAPKSVNL
jgi:hypothetical protein